MVGSDTPQYMYMYQHDFNKLRFGDDMVGRRQPGWVLLSFCCRKITDNFMFFKFIQAIFVNVAIFFFFRRESKYVFMCITLYAITTYLIFNFNVLRQSFAVGFMLYYISFLKRDKYLLAALSLFGAFMFHNTALIGLILIVFKILKYNKRTIIILLAFSFMFVIFLSRLDMNSLMMNIINSGYLGDSLQEQTEMYAESEKFAAKEIGIGIGRMIQLLLTVLTVFYFTWKKRDLFLGGIGLLYLFMLVLNYSIPILFRIRQYFDMSFYLMFSYVIIDISSGLFKQIRHFVIALCLVLFSYYPVKEYFYKEPGVPYRYIDQYYPYHSIFNPNIDHNKINYYKSIK